MKETLITTSRKQLVWLISVLSISLFVHPDDSFAGCSYIEGYTYEGCEGGGGGSGSTKPAGAASTFSEGFNLSSAALPTVPTSYGLEIIGSQIRTQPHLFAPVFSVVKGFKKFGTGISTSASNIFYSNDVISRANSDVEVNAFAPAEPASSSLPNLNIGSSFSAYESDDGKVKGILGVSIRHNQTTATWGGGPAFMLALGRFTIGSGLTQEDISNYLEPIKYHTVMASVSLWIFELEAIRMQHYGGPSLGPVYIMSLSAMFSKFIIAGAVRDLDYVNRGRVQQEHLSVQVLINKHLSIGGMYNYIPGANSLALQYFL